MTSTEYFEGYADTPARLPRLARAAAPRPAEPWPTPADDRGAPALELSVIVPTFKEAQNVAPLLRRLDAALQGVAWEAIFVDDDSPDGTAAAVKSIALVDRRVSCIRRVGRRGLSGAVVEGVLASAAPFVAVIDGDLQHDETILPKMLDALRGGEADLAVGSRYLADAAPVTGLTAGRALGSRFANWLARRVLCVELTDPVSGFFMIRRELIDRVAGKLAPNGFKVLFDIVASQPKPPRVVEIGYRFRERLAGESKLDHGVVAHYLSLLGSKLCRDLISPRALMFGLVGGSGVLVHLGMLKAGLLLGAGFAAAQLVGAVTAMTSNYLVNNLVTYRDRRKTGWSLLTGYLRFCLLCGAGLAANVAVAAMLHEHVPAWWIAGMAGAAVGAAWNYVTTSLAVW